MNRPLQGELGDALGAVLGDMQQSIAQLTQVLEDERTALNAGNSDALGEAGASKQKLMLQLEQLDAERHSLVAKRLPPRPNWKPPGRRYCRPCAGASNSTRATAAP